MRGFDCYWFTYVGKALEQSSSTMCWSGIRRVLEDEKDKVKEIYITKYNEVETEKYQKRLIFIINKITPCSKVIIDKVEYIKFKLIKGYNNNLILLSFIRNLWNNPMAHDKKCNYTEEFFKALKESKKLYSDPLERLTYANKEACPESALYVGHSNVCNKKDLVIRKAKELLDFIAPIKPRNSLEITKDFLKGKK